MSSRRLLVRSLSDSLRSITRAPVIREARRFTSTKPPRSMALLPRFAAFAPSRTEFGPFFNLFNDTFSELQKISDTIPRTWAPRFDMKETQDSFVLDGELPGIDQKDITIEFVDDQMLSIKGRTETVKEEGKEPEEAEAGKEVAEGKKADQEGPTYWYSERSSGEFARTFGFPTPIDQDKVKASLKDGVLHVVVPKSEKANKTKTITIE
ncbi:hypothetical protein PV05_04201 [Exophiala xenobiotica]|uniref:SHSP domain-containing protein n=1 Tax=Exophiala xenobiotica TaxID=348802 RepID=A0A0D2ELF0_9EURO|nr:uncharacterized protein PV05_04201 [Exophiala xenobiotica]KIW55460.1 hypothetical protein PV05_04201 [Exophiala xenobiotica]